VEAAVTAKGKTLGVVLLNMGGPDSLSAVRPFLARLFLDRELIRLPASLVTQPLFAWIVSALRARKVRRYYEEIGGASPIGAITERQRAALERELRADGSDVRVYAAMRYWHPLARRVAQEMKEDGVGRVIALPLYPQYFRGTTGSSFNDLRRGMKWAGLRAPVTEVRSYPDDPLWIAALTETVAGAVEGVDREGMHLLFSAHGIPKDFVDEGDPYPEEIARTVAAVMASFPGLPHSVSYQSRAGRAVWLSPDTTDETVRLAATGVKTLVVVPVAFVSEHIETLHELDIRLSEDAEKAGIRRFVRVPAVNDSPAFIRALAGIARRAAAQERDGTP
jgi:ferrochelatase